MTLHSERDDMSISAIGGGQTSWAQQVQQAQHRHGAHPGVHKAGMDAAATALGMSLTDLRSAVQGGQSLTSLAQAKGVSVDALTSSISAALTTADPSLSGSRAAQITERLIDGPRTNGVGSTGAGDRDHDGDAR